MFQGVATCLYRLGSRRFLRQLANAAVASAFQPLDPLAHHLLHFIPERRSDALEVIEDVIPLFKVKVGLKAPAPVCQVASVPEEASLIFRTEEPYAVFELERIDGHAMVSLTFA